MGEKSSFERLNRYTSLPVLFDMLIKSRIILQGPERWEDRNDVHFLDRYKEEQGLETLVALCCSSTLETFHQWRIFAHGPAGVCIEFDKSRLLSRASAEGFRHGPVEYRTIDKLEKNPPEISSWPFVKRIQFKDECEYRLIFESKKREEPISILVDPACVRRVTLSPWLDDATAKSVIRTIRKFNVWADVEVNHSGLVSNERWKKAVRHRSPTPQSPPTPLPAQRPLRRPSRKSSRL